MNYKRILIYTVLYTLFIALSGCAGKEVRTKWTDKGKRVMIDPENVSEEHYVMIASALVKSGNFIVVDRSAGFNAIKREQERTHRSEVDRFADREKYAHWGKMYGVGGVVVAHADCQRRLGTFKGPYLLCRQHLAIMDTNTAEVIAVADGEQEGDSGAEMVSWEDTVADLEDAYPKYFEKERVAERLEQYKNLSKENATRTKEEYARELIDAERKLAEVKAKIAPPSAPVTAPSAPELPKAETSAPEAPKAPEAEKPEAKKPEAEKVADKQPEPVKEPVEAEKVADKQPSKAEKAAEAVAPAAPAAASAAAPTPERIAKTNNGKGN